MLDQFKSGKESGRTRSDNYSLGAVSDVGIGYCRDTTNLFVNFVDMHSQCQIYSYLSLTGIDRALDGVDAFNAPAVGRQFFCNPLCETFAVVSRLRSETQT